MTTRTPISPQESTRILFLAWGFSIHAKRRIQLFVDDPDFVVAVVSNHDYNFPNARNVLLTGRQGGLRRSFDKIKTVVDGSTILLSSDLFSQIRIQIKHLRILKSFLLSSEIRGELAEAINDFNTLKSAVMEFNPDVVFLQTLLYPSYLAYFLPWSIPIIITFWNGDVIWWAKWTGVERLLKKRLLTYGVRRAKAITVNSQTAFKACQDYGARAEKVHIIRYPGVDLNRFKRIAKEDARRKLEITSDRVVLCPRGLGEYLNSDIIIQAAARVARRYPDSLFVFVSGVGGEQELKKCQGEASRLGIKNNMRWDGQVPWELMPTYYNSSDVMISISSNDSLPNCMLEAMSCGIPMIMGDIPQIREWIVDGANGFLVPTRNPVALSEKVTEVFQGSDEWITSLAKRNLELVQREFNSERNVNQVKNLAHLVAGSIGNRIDQKIKR